MKINKHFIFTLAIIFAVFLGVQFMYVGGIERASAANSLYYLSDRVATSTNTYIPAGLSTTTITRASDGYESISYLLTLGASTTPPVLCWRNQFSQDQTTWYGEDYVVNENATSTTHVRGGREHCWVYSTTTGDTLGDSTLTVGSGSVYTGIYVFKKIVVPTLDTIFVRTVFYNKGGGAARLSIDPIKRNPVVLHK